MNWSLGKPPNQRGKGGRPTKSEQADAGELEGAEKAIQEVESDEALDEAAKQASIAVIRADWQRDHEAIKAYAAKLDKNPLRDGK